ncbi:3-oxoacyl-ACP reductase [Actinopolyspora halophila]|uniref:3-oxoacyl-ACP reductase n=1 Tax=Actinopolyspora halophila TaxID=1850 RepID=UPI000378BF44|nr:3-oxoacyl-ACP reductase [Actinopolyspora halophila]
MADPYSKLVSSQFGRRMAGRLGLPTPTPLRRYRPGDPVVSGPVLIGAAEGSRLGAALTRPLEAVHAEVHETPAEEERYAGLVFDATGIEDSTRLGQLRDFFSPVIRRTSRCGRLIVLGTPPEEIEDPAERTAQRALEGFVRTAGKELKGGSTAQLVHVSRGGEQAVDSTVRFLLSAKSAFVSGQVIRVGARRTGEADGQQPLREKVALVTGASRGIGASIAETLARDGAHVVCLDVPAQGEDLTKVANRVGGSALQLDITAPDAPRRVVEHFSERHEGLDIVVHNAGITRDKTIGRMSEDKWDPVLTVNLAAQERLNAALLADSSPLRRGGRLIGVASISGIAGNVGQANYATSKAGVIGHVQALADRAAERGVTINAVAPGFIETAMTAAVPLVIREAGRRMNSLAQGGLPIDVAETVAFYADPGSDGVNGNVIRVCGQSMLGA